MATKLATILADFRTSLATSVSIGGTSATLQSATDDDGVALPAGKYYFTIDGDSTIKEYWYCDLSGTALTNIVNVSRQGTETAGSIRAHRIGASVVVTNFAHILRLNNLLDGTTDLNASVPLKYDGTATISADEDLATKKYADDLAIAGAPDGSTTVKGIYEAATVAEQGTGTPTGGTGALLVPVVGNIIKTSAGAADENKLIVLNAAGKVDTTAIPAATTSAIGGAEIATAAESAAGTASGGAGILVPANSLFLQSPSATLATNASKGPISNSAGVVDQAWVNTTGTSGGAISVGQAVYVKASDGKLYKTDGTGDESTYSYVGIATTASTGADETIRVARAGQIATGLSGLTAGSWYFITDTAGTIGTTPGTRFAKVGQAMSTTSLRLTEPKFIRTGSQVITSATTFAQTVGFYPTYIGIRAGGAAQASNVSGWSIGDSTNKCVFDNVSLANTASSSATLAWNVYFTNAAAYTNGTVTSITATGFTLNCSTWTFNATVQWTAYSG